MIFLAARALDRLHRRDSMTTPIEFAHSRRAEIEAALCDLLRIPSISTLAPHRADVEKAAHWLVDHLRAIGLDARIVTTDGLPLVYAEWLGAPGRPTVLGYGHYDVQPADPLDLWTTPPFQPTVRGQSLYARGAADDKGQIFTMISAIGAYLRTGTRLPVNVKLVIEGEEESGSAGIAAYVRAHPDRLRADAALVLDSGMFAPRVPAITLGLRGMVATEIEVSGASRDLHSGLYGGVAPNPFVALAEIITGLKDPQGRVLVPHFYDRVAPPHPDEKAAWERLPFNEETFLRDEVGAPSLVGEPGFSVLERIWGRPTLEVHGMPGGFVEAGFKTVIPARASAKISMRLVADQDPEEIFRAYDAHIRRMLPRGTRVAVTKYSTAKPVVISPDASAIKAARRALGETFGREPVFMRTGGSIPIVADFITRLGLPAVVTGWTLPDANIHSPNEKLDLEHFHLGIRAVMQFFENFSHADGRGAA
jgi:acetylornithine deacetylase/succinyl-diaminopimelate desuccinylase-like protein